MGRLKIFLTNLGKYVNGYLVGEWVKLPVPKDKLNDILNRIGIDEHNEFFITDYETTLNQLQSAEGITENMKAANPMVWVQHMNNICSRAEELVREELIYT